MLIYSKLHLKSCDYLYLKSALSLVRFMDCILVFLLGTFGIIPNLLKFLRQAFTTKSGATYPTLWVFNVPANLYSKNARARTYGLSSLSDKIIERLTSCRRQSFMRACLFLDSEYWYDLGLELSARQCCALQPELTRRHIYKKVK